MRETHFTGHGLQFTVGDPSSAPGCDQHAENGKRKTKDSRSLFASAVIGLCGIARVGISMKHQLQIGVAVAAGGGLGTLGRASIAAAMVSWGVASLWGVLLVNIVGALALGWYAAHVRESNRWSTLMVGFVAAGVLGSFTTFSAFSLEVVELFETGDWFMGSAYAVVTVGLGLVAATLGRRFAEQR